VVGAVACEMDNAAILPFSQIGGTWAMMG
jgi:hypothetical protein